MTSPPAARASAPAPLLASLALSACLLLSLAAPTLAQSCNSASSNQFCECGPSNSVFATKCDGFEECPDKSDESAALCDKNTYQCSATGRFACPLAADATTAVCLSRDRVCDGSPDCPVVDGVAGDESEALCSESHDCTWGGNFTRSSCGGSAPIRCLDLSLFCDGNPDCPLNFDETAETCLANFTCAPGKLSCKGEAPVRCLDNYLFCDGSPDCPNGFDETEEGCPPDFDCSPWGQVACGGTGINRCQFGFLFCDGKEDCPNGNDESAATCNSFFACSNTGRISCPRATNTSKRLCITASQRCDGSSVDCPGGWDEDPKQCRDFNCIPSGGRTAKIACPKGGFTGTGFLRTYYCIDPAKICNGVPDSEECPEGDDESECATFDCASIGRVRCPGNSSQCIDEAAKCDGIDDCADGSDESPQFCKTYNCTLTNRDRCPKGSGCMPKGATCDGVANCKDKSDESRSLCRRFNCARQGMVKCPSRRHCVFPDQLCDGVADCRDGSDEARQFCRTFNCTSVNKVKCPRKGDTKVRCVELANFCDGEADCPRGTDEAPLFNCAAHTCAPGFIKCKANNTCTPGQLCDGFADDCEGNAYDEDPAMCAAYQCPEGFWKCGDNKKCIPESRVCDNAQRADCEDSSDESPALCASYDCSKTGRFTCPGAFGGCLPSSCSVCGASTARIVGLCQYNPLTFVSPDTDPKYCSLRGGECPELFL